MFDGEIFGLLWKVLAKLPKLIFKGVMALDDLFKRAKQEGVFKQQIKLNKSQKGTAVLYAIGCIIAIISSVSERNPNSAIIAVFFGMGLVIFHIKQSLKKLEQGKHDVNAPPV